MSVLYPEQLDNDASIPQIEDAVSEITADSINPIRDAVLSLEQYVGINPQGTKSDLNTRISVSINPDGTLKTSALAGLGLVTLPIYNNQIAANAGIQESKLALNFPTSVLNNNINVLSNSINTLQTAIATVGGQLSTHIIGNGYNHDGYSIFVNKASAIQIGIGGLTATTIGDATNQLAGLLVGGTPTRIPHINLSLPSQVKHEAAEIGINTEHFVVIDKSVVNVQQAFNSLDQNQGAFGREHVKGFHSNGIFKVVTAGDGYNINYPLITNNPISYNAGSTVVTFASQINTLGIQPGDIFVLQNTLDNGFYQINAIGPLGPNDAIQNLTELDAYQISLYYVFKNTNSAALGSIYKSATISSNLAPLACAVKSNETLVDSITILNPNSATAVSLGFNAAIINGDGYDLGLTVGIGDGYTRTLVIPNLNLYRLSAGQAEPVSAISVAERINAYVSDPTLGNHFPVSAFAIGNEIAIAHTLVGPQYTLQILDGYSANFALGFDSFGAKLAGITLLGNINENYTVNGETLNTIHTVFDGYGISTGSNNYMLYGNNGVLINPYDLGIQGGDTIHVTNHTNINSNGSYVLLSASTTTVSTFNVEVIPAGTFNVLITNSNISLNVLDTVQPDAGVFQLFINEFGVVETYERMVYNNSFGFGPAISVVNVSNAFPPGLTSINVQVNSNSISFNTISNSISGETVTISPGFTGSFNLYHFNNTEYFTIFVEQGTIISTNVTVEVFPFPNIDEVLLLSTAHFNNAGLDIDYLIDNRLFGTIAEEHIRNDFIEIFSQRPVEELRSNGIASGFDILPLPQYDTATNIPALPISGGVAYVQGVRVAINTQKVLVPAFDSMGNSISGTFVIALNNLGTLATYNIPLSEMLLDGYSASITYGKLLPLYQIVFSGSAITQIADVRPFINNIDNKLDIIIENQGNNLGNFKDLNGALVYAANYPTKEKLVVRIINQVNLDGYAIVPQGVSIVGSSLFGNTCSIVNNVGSTQPLLTLLGNNTLENISVSTNLPGLNQQLVNIVGSNVRIENCSFTFAGPISSGLNNSIAINLSGGNNNTTIRNNIINTVFTGIFVNDGVKNLLIENNNIINVSGIGGLISSGIYIQNPTLTSNNIRILNNNIDVPYVLPDSSDIRFIYINVGKEIGRLKIAGNNMLNTAFVNSNLVGAVTYGIHIDNSSSTAYTVEDILIKDNTIRGIKSDGSGNWGIYVDTAEKLIVATNTITDVGVDGYQGTSVPIGHLYLGGNVINANIENNIFIDGYCDLGISSQAVLANINNNTIQNIGNTAIYISGDGYNSLINANTILGAGDYGIQWGGSYSLITNNIISGTSTQSFSLAGIASTAPNIDIANNTLSNIIQVNSIGITNSEVGNTYTKIQNNTVSGSNMQAVIQIFDANNLISGNKLYNQTSNGTTSFIQTNGISYSKIANNFISGSALYGITATTAVINQTSIIDNDFSAANLTGIVGSSIITGCVFNLAGATNCLINNNTLPYVYSATPYGQISSLSPSPNIIGPVPSATITNTNTIGINKNLLDTVQANVISGQPLGTSSAVPLWIPTGQNGGAMYWTNNIVSGYSSTIFFPINNIPSGASINSVQLVIYNPSSQLYFSVIQRGSNGSFISSPSIQLPSSSSIQNIYQVLTTPIVVNSSYYNYYISLVSTATSSGDASNIYSLSVNFQY